MFWLVCIFCEEMSMYLLELGSRSVGSKVVYVVWWVYFLFWFSDVVKSLSFCDVKYGNN